MPKISAVVPDEHFRSLEEQARLEDRSLSAVVRRAIAEHLASTESAAPSLEHPRKTSERVKR